MVFEGSEKVEMTSLLRMASERSKQVEPQSSGSGTSHKQYFKDREIRIIKIFRVVECKICASFVTFCFSGAL